MDVLRVVGAKQHNLKNVDCEIPRNRFVVITGPSGSGKSSLAFDTIYAEGQRRYVESLSLSARQFLERLPRPEVTSIDGLSPAIAIRQAPLGRGIRSTVGTVTELWDALRLLFTHAGTAYCPRSGKPLKALTVPEIVDRLLTREVSTRFILLAPVQRGVHDDWEQKLQELRRQGYVRARLDEREIELAETLPSPDPTLPHELFVVVDRLVIRDGLRGRLTDSVELALRLGKGTLLVDWLDAEPREVLSERLVSWEYDITLPLLEPSLFSFNSPHGACPACSGLGEQVRVDPARVVGHSELSLRQGALPALGARGSVAFATELKRIVDATGVDPDVPWSSLAAPVRQRILYGDATPAEEVARKSKARSRKRKSYTGLIPRLQAMFDSEDAETWPEDEPEFGGPDVEQFVREQPCAVCHGTRLRPEANYVRVQGQTVSELDELTLEQLARWLEDLVPSLALDVRPIAAPIVKTMQERVRFLLEVGLGYLTLHRGTATLSGGEAQRARLATQLGVSLTGVLYVLDEPSLGLHARDNQNLQRALRQLVQGGNSVLVVEHDRDTILAADYVLDLGPGAGEHGGHIVARGTPEELARDPKSVTGPYLQPAPRNGHDATTPAFRESIDLHAVSIHNLKRIDASIPIGKLTAVTGVSGSGKSSLILDTLFAAARTGRMHSNEPGRTWERITGLDVFERTLLVDQAPIGRTPRSNPATYSGIFSLLRELYAEVPEARARGYQPGRFSFNVKGGRCEKCLGAGVRRVEMQFLPDLYVECDACQGQRYHRETLEIRFQGLHIAEALQQTVDEASALFQSIPRIAQRLTSLREVGLGYLRLGQAATTLSGGEAQRLKLATELARTGKGPILYLLDEPTAGLHFSDVDLLMNGLLALRDAGHTLIVIEHNLDLVARADWVIDMGPEGGPGGGEIVAQGTPFDVARAPTHTGRHLASLFTKR